MRSSEFPQRIIEFEMCKGLKIPRDTVHRVVEDIYHVFLSPEKASFIVTSQIGARLVEFFQEGATLKDAMQRASDEFQLSEERVSHTMAAVLRQIEKHQFYSHSQVVEAVQKEFTLHCYLTKRCTLQCTHCYVSAGPLVSMKSDLTTEEWKAVLSSFKNFVVNRLRMNPIVVLSGGEPMIREDLFEISEFAHQAGIEVQLFTNGTCIKGPETVARLARSVANVQISLDGATAKANDLIRGQGSFASVIRAMRLLARSPVRRTLAITLVPANFEDLLENLPDLIRSFGGPDFGVRIGFATVQGRADRSMAFADEVAGERAATRVLSNLYQSGLRIPRHMVPTLKAKSCGYGEMMCISSDGTVYGCAMEQCPIASVREVPLAEAALRTLDLAAATTVDRLKGCEDCELMHFCLGHCRLNNFSQNGSLSVSNCSIKDRQEQLRKVAYHEVNAPWPFAGLWQ